jgi:hypothetical protein
LASARSSRTSPCASSAGPDRDCRRQRLGQDHADPHADRRDAAGQGTITLAKTLTGIVIDQQRKLISPEKRVRDVLADGSDWIDVRGVRKHVQGYLKEFLFDPELIEARIGTLSGGERRACCSPANLRGRRICWCSTSRPMTLIWKRSTCCRK